MAFCSLAVDDDGIEVGNDKGQVFQYFIHEFLKVFWHLC